MGADRPEENTESRPAFDDARLQLARLHVVPGSRLRDAWLQLAELAAKTLRVDRVAVWVLIEDGRALQCRYLLQRSTNEVFQGVVLRAQDFPNYFAAMSEQRVITINDAIQSPVTAAFRAAYLEPLGITSMLDAPLYIEGKLAGVVCHEHIGPPRTWDSAECDFASAVADNISRLYGEYKRVNAQSALDAHRRHLLELNRMEAVGRMALGVAHDFRSILGAARGFAELIRRAPDKPAQVDRYASRIIDALDRGSQLSREMTEFGREENCRPRVLDTLKVIHDLEPMFRILLGQQISLSIANGQRVSRVFMDSSQLERALLNLVLNARDAMAAGGQLEISAEDVEVTNDDGEAAKWVQISVADNGVGMDAQTRDKALNPFFTTKSSGTGLGLSIVEQIISHVGGFLRIDSEQGRGTTVRLHVPRIAASA
jgi:two-component system cell cycle sensor histidine kinase/response regulator CckA